MASKYPDDLTDPRILDDLSDETVTTAPYAGMLDIESDIISSDPEIPIPKPRPRSRRNSESRNLKTAARSRRNSESELPRFPSRRNSDADKFSFRPISRNPSRTGFRTAPQSPTLGLHTDLGIHDMDFTTPIDGEVDFLIEATRKRLADLTAQSDPVRPVLRDGRSVEPDLPKSSATSYGTDTMLEQIKMLQDELKQKDKNLKRCLSKIDDLNIIQENHQIHYNFSALQTMKSVMQFMVVFQFTIAIWTRAKLVKNH